VERPPPLTLPALPIRHEWRSVAPKVGVTATCATREEPTVGAVVDDEDVLARIDALVEEEHQLRSGDEGVARNSARLSELEVRLDQCWDLLRQRRARREFGEDPGDVHVRSVDTVEHYEQ